MDELALTQHDTEWTVYLGTEVNPKAQLEALLRNVDIRKVVSGDTNEMITSSGQMLGGTNDQSKTMKLTDYLRLNDSQITELVNTLLAGGSKTYPYNSNLAAAYNHGHVGDIRISLAEALGCYTKGNHATERTGIDAQYTLKVEYVPRDGSTRNGELGITADDYHTTQGGSAGDPTGTMTSTNTHLINVFAKKLQLCKVDMNDSSQAITHDSAKFTLYREDANGAAVEGLPTGNTYTQVTALETSTSGTNAGWTAETDNLPLGTYWLVETKAPAGYLPASPLKVEVVVAEDASGTQAVLKSSNGQLATEDEKPIGWNFKQEATLNIADGAYAVLHDSSTGGANAASSDTTTIKYDIKNSSGVELPAAGGAGLVPVYVLGAALVAAAGAVLVRRRAR